MKKILGLAAIGAAFACTSGPKHDERGPSAVSGAGLGSAIKHRTDDPNLHRSNYAVIGRTKGAVVQFRRDTKELEGVRQDVILIEECRPYAELPDCNPTHTVEIPMQAFVNRLKLSLRLGSYTMIPGDAGSVPVADAVKGSNPRLREESQELAERISEMKNEAERMERFLKRHGAGNVDQQKIDELRVLISDQTKKLEYNSTLVKASQALNDFTDKVVDRLFDKNKIYELVNGKDNDKIEWTILNTLASPTPLLSPFARINPGAFQIINIRPVSQVSGQPPKPPAQSVTTVQITKPYDIGMTEVTQYDYVRIMGRDISDNPSTFKNASDCKDHTTLNGISICPLNPVEGVGKSEIDAFVAKLNAMDSYHTYRLPSEAEWELAARADSTDRYTYGKKDADKADEHAWSGDNSRSTMPVGMKLRNGNNLFDIHGNVAEWVLTSYAPRSQQSSDRQQRRGRSQESQSSQRPVVDPCSGCGSDAQLVHARGGSYLAKSDECRLDASTTPNVGSSVGFRLIRIKK